MSEKKLPVLLLYTLTAVAYYALVCQYIRNIDDFNYAFMVSEADVRIPVTSLADAIRSQCTAYFCDNGRFLIHVVVQYLAALPSVVPYCLLSTVMFLLLLEGIGRLARNSKPLSVAERLAALFLTVALNTHPGNTLFCNMAFTINYMWTGTAIVWFLLLFRREYRRNGTCRFAKGIGLFMAGVACGSLQESFSIGIAGWLSLVLVCRRHSLNVPTRLLAAGFLSGTVILVAAPANFQRLQYMNDGFSLLFSAVKFYGFWVGLLAGAALLWLNRRLAPETLRANAVFYIAGAINLLFAVFIACNGARQHFATTLYITVIALHLLLRLQGERLRRHSLIVSATLLLVMAPVYAGAWSARERLWHENEKFWQRFVSAGDTLVAATEYYDLQREMFESGHFNRFTDLGFLEAHRYKTDVMNLYATEGRNPKLRSAVLPDDTDSIVALCRPVPSEGIAVFHSRQHDYFVVVATCENRSETETVIMQSPRAALYRTALQCIKPYKFAQRVRLGDTDIRFTRGDTVYYVFSNVDAEKRIQDICPCDREP